MGSANIYDRETNSYYDHMEIYYTNDKKYIIISSPYAPSALEDEESHNKFIKYYEERGFKLYNPLYINSAITFIRIIE